MYSVARDKIHPTDTPDSRPQPVDAGALSPELRELLHMLDVLEDNARSDTSGRRR